MTGQSAKTDICTWPVLHFGERPAVRWSAPGLIGKVLAVYLIAPHPRAPQPAGDQVSIRNQPSSHLYLFVRFRLSPRPHVCGKQSLDPRPRSPCDNCQSLLKYIIVRPPHEQVMLSRHDLCSPLKPLIATSQDEPVHHGRHKHRLD